MLILFDCILINHILFKNKANNIYKKGIIMKDKIIDYEIELIVNQRLYECNEITKDLYIRIKNILLKKIEELKN